MASISLGVPPRHGMMAVGAGLLSAAAFPPLGLWFCSLMSLAVFLAVIGRQDVRTSRNLGFVFGFVHAAGTMYWLVNIFGTMALALIGLMAAYFGLLATLVGLTRNQSPWLRAVLVAIFAIAIEWLRGDAWYLRFPWYTPPHALSQSPVWIASVRWLGTSGLSALVWFIAAAGALIHWRYWGGFLVIPAFSLLLSSIGTPDRQALLLQFEQQEDAELVIGKIPTIKVDLTVLPELATTRSPASALARRDGPGALARKVSSPIVFGAIEGDYYNSSKFLNVAAVADEDGKLLGTFTKQHPVPLMRDGIPGTERPVFPLPQGVLGVAICYDFDAPAIAASLVRSGATVLAVPTFDAMWWSPNQHVHHELLVRLRAVENDRWILRAASSGRTEVIDPHGNPSKECVEVGAVGYVVLPFAHRNTRVIGGQMWILGPLAAAATSAFLIVLGWGRIRSGGTP